MLAVRELRSWAESLPLGNPPRAAQLLLEQLRLLVRDPDPGHRLANLLEAYEQPLARLAEIVTERHEQNQDLALPLDQLEDTLLQLLNEMAYGQLRVANHLLGSGKQPPATLLYRALDLLDAAHNVELLHYCRRNAARWNLMLAIYLHANQHGIDSETVDIPPRRPDAPTDIAGLFFRALLISLSDPHHRRPGDILAWHRWIGTHAGNLELTQLPQGAFSIPVDTSGAMDPLTAARRGKPGPDTRYLAAEAFLRVLHADNEAPARLYEALNDLIRGRKSPEQRRSPRQPRRHPFRLLCGLHQVHARLSALTSGMADDHNGSGQALSCLQVDHSRDGAAFKVQGPVHPPLGIGDTILAETDGSKPGGAPVGFVGRIRRIVAEDRQHIEIGVEKLPGRLIPVTLSGGAAERARGDTYGLLQQTPDNGRFCLLAVRNLYREGDTVIAESINARYSLRMQGLLGSTRRVAYIEVETLD